MVPILRYDSCESTQDERIYSGSVQAVQTVEEFEARVTGLRVQRLIDELRRSDRIRFRRDWTVPNRSIRSYREYSKTYAHPALF